MGQKGVNLRILEASNDGNQFMVLFIDIVISVTSLNHSNPVITAKVEVILRRFERIQNK